MSKLMYVNKTQFAQLQGVLTEIFKKEFSECSAEDQKKILRAVNAKSIKDLLHSHEFSAPTSRRPRRCASSPTSTWGHPG